MTEPAPKRARKTLNKKERKDLGDYLKSVDDAGCLSVCGA